MNSLNAATDSGASAGTGTTILVECPPCGSSSMRTTAKKLHELIEALDRRVPRLEHAGEASIARDAAALRARAVNRLADLGNQAACEPQAQEERGTRKAGEAS